MIFKHKKQIYPSAVVKITNLPVSYRILEPSISNSICMQERSPLLCSSRFILIGAKNGFLASNGLQEN